MALYKAVKLEIMILTEADLSDAEILKWSEDAMLNFCDFREAVVKIKEKHERIICDFENEYEA